MRPVPLKLPGLSSPLTSWVGLDQSHMQAALQKQLLGLGATLAVLLLAILAVTLSISTRIVQALRFVVEKMRLLQHGQYQRIDPVIGRNEIAYLGHGFNEMITGLIERDFVRETFGRYMSSEVARAVLDNPEGLEMGGEAREVTILMCDLRGFTSFSGNHSPSEVVRVLNIFLGRMADVILDHDGTINEFLGDAILALFGAPVRREDDALRAVACAVAMQRAMADVNATLAEEGIPPLRMGIGLATGVVVAGNIGSRKRVKYGVVGQPVNLASRVESFTVGDDLFIAGSTRDAAGDTVETGPVRRVKVKGSAELLDIYPVLGVGGEYQLRMPKADEPEEERWPLPEGATASIWPILGKEVASEALTSRALELGSTSLQLASDGSLTRWSDVKLQLKVGESQTGENLYAKVVEVGERSLLRLTRVSPEDRELLDRLLRGLSEG